MGKIRLKMDSYQRGYKFSPGESRGFFVKRTGLLVVAAVAELVRSQPAVDLHIRRERQPIL